MRRFGVDVSEFNGHIDWNAMKEAGVEFAIIRMGWGKRHLDSEFYNNVNGCEEAGLPYGVYYYSYALDDEQAAEEADYCLETLKDCAANPTLGVWFDMENDNYKQRNEFTDPQEITNACSVFINHVWEDETFDAGLYANYDWLTNVIRTDQLGGVAIWCAQYSNECDYPNPRIWQFSDKVEIGGQMFDGDYLYE